VAVITWDQIQSVLDDLVAEKGADYVYEPPVSEYGDHEDCQYLHHGEPGCLIGHLLVRLGEDEDWLASREGENALDVVKYSHLEFEDRTHVATFLAQAQGYQDDCIPWGQAVRMAREVDRASRS
jgi:hypothetical protein